MIRIGGAEVPEAAAGLCVLFVTGPRRVSELTMNIS
jgi:hypothetical protein